MEKNTQINCPKCGHVFNVEEVISKQIEEKYKTELNSKISEIENNYQRKEQNILYLEKQLKQKELDIDKAIEAKLQSESAKRERQIKERLSLEYDEQIKLLTDENETGKKQIQLLNRTKIENEQLKRKLEEQKDSIEAEYEQKLTERLKEATTDIKKKESERVELKLREKEEVINSMKEQMEEMKRKAEQGSMQLQGEVQELVLEEVLKEMFPYDVISEVAKGMKGADVMQTVKNNKLAECGKILYESKRTKKFSDEWIDKLKNDAIAAKADVCIIVTEALPEGMEKIGSKDGVWICSFNDFKGLVIVIREYLIKVQEVYSAQSNTGDKMQMLYNYLTGNEFKMQIEAIADGFANLQDGYIKEKRAMERIWKEREKQLERILLNTNHFIGSIQGIAGSSLPQLQKIGGDNLLEI
jgi:Uncharacterized protein conserved in bacteria